MGKVPVIIQETCMKTKVMLLLICLWYFAAYGKETTAVAEPDSLTETDSCTALPADLSESLSLSERTKKSVVCNSAQQHYNNWYSFERPEALYAKKYLRQSIAPAAVAALGLGILGMTEVRLQLQEELNWNKDLKVPMYDDQLRYAPIAIGLVLPLFGNNPKHKLLHLVPLVSGSYILADGIVHQLKAHTAMARPNGSQEYDAFPSQHSSMAFVAATILHHEFGEYSPWISIGGYALASWVAYARVAKDDHWTSDVLTGAAIGTLSTHLVYLSYDFISDLFTGKNLSFCPYLIEGGGGVYLSFSF